MTLLSMGTLGGDNAEATAQLAAEAVQMAIEKGMLEDGTPCEVLMTRTVVTGSDADDLSQRSETLSKDLKAFIQREDRDGTRLYPTAVYTDAAHVSMMEKIRVAGQTPQDTLDEIRRTLAAQGGLSEEDIEAAVQYAGQQMFGMVPRPHDETEADQYTPMTLDQLLDVGLWEIRRPTWAPSRP